MKQINAAVMFANAGIGEFYAHLANVKNMVAVEYDPDRADLYKCIYPHCYVFPDDINKVMEAFIAKAKECNCSLLMASPPCQGHSRANQSENKDEDIRNRLILKVTDAVEKGNFDTVMIENVPEFLDYSSDTILPELEGKNIRQYLEEFFRTHGYMVNFISVLMRVNIVRPHSNVFVRLFWPPE